MKTILVILFCIASSKCGVLKDDIKQSNVAACNRFETHLIIITDTFAAGDITLLTDILIDVTKPQEGRPINIESVTKKYLLQPGMHKWEHKFQPSQQSADEIDRIVSIVEKTAKATGQLVSKKSTTGDDTITWEFNINIDVTSQPLSKKHKREINAKPSETEHRLIEIHLIRIMDSFEDGNVTLLTEVLIDVTKDQEGRPSNSDSVTINSKLLPGMHKWQIMFIPTHQSEDEMNRILSIVEKSAKKTGQLVSKNSTTGDNTVTWEFYINVDATNQTSSKKHKRDTKFQNNAQPTDIEEINRLLSLAAAAENKDSKNCKTTDGVVICNVYIPNDSSKIHKREIEFQNNTPPTDEDEIKEKPDIVTPAVNPTVIVDGNGNTCTETATATVDNKVYCIFSTSTFLVGGCPAGTDRADDNSCVPIV